MFTTVYLCNQTVQALVGVPGKRARITALVNRALPEGVIINGVIIDREALERELAELFKSVPRKRVQLVIDSSQLLIHALSVPKGNDKTTLELVRRDFAATGQGEYVLDYMRFRPRAGETMDFLLSCAVQREILESFVSLFEGLRIRLEGITIAQAAKMRLLDSLASMREQTCVVLVFDGNNMLATLLENGRYKYASRTRLLSEPGTPEQAREVSRTISGILQFQMAEKSRYAISNVYFGGCEQAVLDACSPAIQDLGLRADWFEQHKEVHFTKEGMLRDCLFTAGNYLVR